jgi:hypothetical protein
MINELDSLTRNHSLFAAITLPTPSGISDRIRSHDTISFGNNLVNPSKEDDCSCTLTSESEIELSFLFSTKIVQLCPTPVTLPGH